jgi:hypothetical protein
MSELAFNLNGEPFEVPSAAIGWRVRKMKPKGAPEVVYSRDGVPLILPIDADIDDLRRSARSEGRFRLDPVDEHNRMIVNASAGYVCVPASENPPEAAPLASRVPSDNVAIEAMKLNTELARSIIDKFPMMMESAAALLRAADGAGLTTRPPRPVADDESDKEDESDEEDDQVEDQNEEAAPKASGLLGLIETIAPFVMPAIMSAIAGGNLKIPGGLGALLDCRRASPKARSKVATPAPQNTPGPRDPASTERETTAPRAAVPRAPTTRVPGRRDTTPMASVPMASIPMASVPMASAPMASVPMASAPRFASSGEVSARESSEIADTPAVHVATQHDANPAVVETSAPRSHVDTAPAGASSAPEPGDEVNNDRAAPPVAAESTMEPDNELPTLDSTALAHFAAIQSALTFREGMLARALAAELTPADLRTWLDELRQLSVADAVARIRSVLGDETSDDTTGGVS